MSSATFACKAGLKRCTLCKACCAAGYCIFWEYTVIAHPGIFVKIVFCIQFAYCRNSSRNYIALIQRLKQISGEKRTSLLSVGHSEPGTE